MIKQRVKKYIQDDFTICRALQRQSEVIENSWVRDLPWEKWLGEGSEVLGRFEPVPEGGRKTSCEETRDSAPCGTKQEPHLPGWKQLACSANRKDAGTRKRGQL